MISAGIDCGAKNMKTVILKDGQIVGKAKVLTGFDLEKAVEDSLVQALKTAGISKDNVQRVCGTGSGKDSIKMAEDTIDDIKAMSKGANFFFPTPALLWMWGRKRAGRQRVMKGAIRSGIGCRRSGPKL